MRGQSILIGTYREHVVGTDGEPVLRLPAGWKGPVVERLAIPVRAECGPQFAGMPVICTSRSAPGRRWYRCGLHTEEVPVPPNGIDMLSSDYERSYERWECEPGHETLCVRLHPSVLERYLQDAGCHFDVRTDYAHQDAVLARLLFELADEVQAGMPNGALFAEGVSLTIFGWLLRHYALRLAPRPVAKGGFSAAQQKRVREFIDTFLGDTLNLESMAGELGMSPFHFLRLFRKSFGTTPHRYVLHARVIRAAQMLRTQPERGISDIAFAMGFSSQAHLTVAFRRQFGQTPAKWRGGRG